MFDFVPESARWALGVLGSVFVWMYVEAKSIKKNIASKVDKSTWDKELADMERRNKETNERIERQGKAELEDRFNRLNDRISNIDDKLDLIYGFLKDK